jgi:aminoglycoside phosphotransferase (APT) family kinase protein
LAAPDWQREPVWFHGDLLSGNVLVEQGRLSAVIDFGGLAVGDFDSVIFKLWHTADVMRNANESWHPDGVIGLSWLGPYH